MSFFLESLIFTACFVGISFFTIFFCELGLTGLAKVVFEVDGAVASSKYPSPLFSFNYFPMLKV